MSSVSSSYALVPRRQFITSMVFNTNIFQYSTYIDSSLATRGRLVIHPSATLNNCIPGAILRENGKKLHSGTHPDLKDPTTNLQYTQLVGVYDIASGINGFINPDAPYFAVLNTDKSYQDDTLVNQVDASQNTPDNNWGLTYSANGQQILGPPVNTRGDISSEGYVTGGQVHAVNLFHTPGYIVSGPDSLILNPVDPITGFAVTYGAGTMLAQSNITSLANIYASNGLVYGSNVQAMCNVTAGNMVYASNGVVSSNGQIRVNTIKTYAVSANASTISLDVSLGQVQQINFTGSPSSATLDAINILPGAVVYVIMNNGSTNTMNILLGNNVREAFGSPNGNYTGAGTAYNTVNFIVPANTAGTITFVSNGTSLFEVARVLNMGS